MRNDNYKLVSFVKRDYDQTTDACATKTSTEFYAINEDVNDPEMGMELKLDRADEDLLADGNILTPQEKVAFKKLTKELDKLLDSVVPCPGDGNLDGIVDMEDINQLDNWELSSWYDFNLDVLTNDDDLLFITDGKFPRKCPKSNSKPM